MLHCLSFGTDSLSTCSTEDSSSTPVYPQSSQCIRRTTFFSSMTGSTTLNTRADPIERAAGGKEQHMEKEMSEETLDTRAGPTKRATGDIEQV